MKKVVRPWGRFLQFVHNAQCTVKVIEVKPNQVLSLQKHKKRKEEWYFLTEGYVQIGDKKKSVKKGEIVKIRKGRVHRLFAKKKPVQILEIAYGDFQENDIIRLEDKYGRK